PTRRPGSTGSTPSSGWSSTGWTRSTLSRGPRPAPATGRSSPRRSNGSSSPSSSLLEPRPEPQPFLLVGDAGLEGGPRPAVHALAADLEDPLVLLELGPVGRQLVARQRAGLSAEEDLQQRRVPQLGKLVGRLLEPRGQRPAALRRELVVLPAPASLLAS